MHIQVVVFLLLLCTMHTLTDANLDSFIYNFLIVLYICIYKLFICCCFKFKKCMELMKKENVRIYYS